jgi:dipeptidyl aminopeptidase/acylaminoacyl peptidase
MARPFVPEDLFRIRQVTDVTVHPDGVRAAYVVSWCDEATDANRSEIWLVPGPAGAAVAHRRLTRAHAADSPRFSPDGQSLAYLAGGVREPAQLHVLPLDGGEPAPMGPFDDGCSAPVWLPDSSGLLVIAPLRPAEEQGLSRDELAERPRPRRITTTRYRANGRGWIHDRVDQLFLVRLDGSPPQQLTEGPWPVAEPAVSPDGRRAMVTSAREADQEWLGGRDLWLVDLPGALDGDSTSIRRDRDAAGDSPIDSTSIRRLTNGQGSWELARFVGDGSQLLVVGHETRGDAGLAVPWLLDVADGCPRRLGDGEISVHGISVVGSSVAVLDDAVVLPGIRRGRVRVDRYPLDGSPPVTLADDPPMISAFALDREGRRLLYAASSPTCPAELFELQSGGVVRPLTTSTTSCSPTSNSRTTARSRSRRPTAIPSTAWSSVPRRRRPARARHAPACSTSTVGRWRSTGWASSTSSRRPPPPATCWWRATRVAPTGTVRPTPAPSPAAASGVSTGSTCRHWPTTWPAWRKSIQTASASVAAPTAAS